MPGDVIPGVTNSTPSEPLPVAGSYCLRVVRIDDELVGPRAVDVAREDDDVLHAGVAEEIQEARARLRIAVPLIEVRELLALLEDQVSRP